MKKILLIVVIVILAMLFAGCLPEADVASQNVSREADQFRVYRVITFYNGITGEDFRRIEGYCSLGNYDSDGELSVTCKVGNDQYKKIFLGLSDNVTYIAEQPDPVNVSGYHYRIVVRPSAIIPDLEIDLP